MRTRLAPLLVAAALAVPLAPVSGSLAASPTERAPRPLVVTVLSNRADLVSGGDALVAVELPTRLDPGAVEVLVGEPDVTDRFAVRRNGRFEGLLTGLAVGRNVVQRDRARGTPAGTVITNHPNGGPVFSGPQLAPYQCQETAVDAQCNEPATYSLPLQVDRPDEAGPAALRPATTRRRTSRRRPPTRASRCRSSCAGGRLPGPRPLHDPHALPARAGRGRPGSAAGAVEPQGARHPRRRLRRVVRPGQPAARRLLRHHPDGVPGVRAELRHRARQRLRGAVDRARQHRAQLQPRDAGRVADDGQGAAGRAVRPDPLHDRHRLLGRLDRPAHDRQRLPRHLPGPGHDLLLPRRADRRRAVRRLPPAAALLRGPVALGAGRRVVARRRWPPVEGHAHATSTRSPPTRGCSRSAINPENACSGTKDPVAGDRVDPLRLRDQPGRRALLDPRHHGQPARPAAGVGVERSGRRRPGHGFAGRAVRQRRRAVRPRRAASRADHARPVRRPQREGRRPRHRRRPDRRPHPGRPAVDRATSTAPAWSTRPTTSTRSRSSTTAAPTRAPPTTTPRVVDRGAADGRPGPHRQPGHVVRPDPADRRPGLGQRGAARDGPLARRGREGQARRCRWPRRSSTTSPPTSPTAARSPPRSTPRASRVPSDVCHRPEFQTRLRTPRQVAGGPSANDNVACRLQPLDRVVLLRGVGQELPVPVPSPTTSGHGSRRSSPTASATGRSPVADRARPRPGCATATPTATSCTADSRCPPYRPTRGPAGRARRSASC